MNSLIYGIHALQAVLDQAPERLIQVWLAKDRQDQRLQMLIEALTQLDISLNFVDKSELDQKCLEANRTSMNGRNRKSSKFQKQNKDKQDDKQDVKQDFKQSFKQEVVAHQGVVALVQAPKSYNEHDLNQILEQQKTKNKIPLILILDGVTDPHNLGACLRSADAAGVCCVITPKDRSATLNATAAKVACGASETVPLVRVTNLARTIKMLQEQNIWVVGAAGEATHSLYQSKLNGAVALVMGAEGHGLRRLTRELCDELISIPMQGSVSSLNVSVATGICLFEALRQRLSV